MLRCGMRKEEELSEFDMLDAEVVPLCGTVRRLG